MKIGLPGEESLYLILAYLPALCQVQEGAVKSIGEQIFVMTLGGGSGISDSRTVDVHIRRVRRGAYGRWTGRC